MSSSVSAFFDESRWPLLVLRQPGAISMKEHDLCLAMLNDYMRRGERHLLLIDLSHVGLMPHEQRWRQVEWLEQSEALIRQTVIGIGTVVTSPAARLSASTVLYFKPPPVPHYLFSNWEAAEAWAADLLREAGLLQAGRER